MPLPFVPVYTQPGQLQWGRASRFIQPYGVALAASHAGAILEQEEFIYSAHRLVKQAQWHHTSGCAWDLISGNAGAIVALLSLQELLEEPSLLAFAVLLGDELLASAVKSKDGYSWRTINTAYEQNLTGFSHGAAGVGYALLELFVATGEARYWMAAESAFQYERSWFNPEAGNWPDLRGLVQRRRRIQTALPFSTYWCHGAPGIALARLRAYKVKQEERWKAEAMVALQTTLAMVETTLRSGSVNFSLCHGLAGNAEVLRTGSEVLGRDFVQGYQAAAEVAECGLEMYVQDGQCWPCGADGGMTPSLMLGLAGIGHFYLRLYDASIPSVLLWDPRALSN